MPIVAICNWLRRGTVKSVNHAMNLQDLFRQLFNHPRTLEDLRITEERSKQIMSATMLGENPYRILSRLHAYSQRRQTPLMHDAKNRSNKQTPN